MTATADLGTAEIHHQHRDVTGGWLRPATFGVVDGLVSNFALVAGVVGGGAGTHTVLLTGLAGLTAGACSMATGEFVSVSSQNELAQAEIAREQHELATNPAGELRELTLAYQAKGVRQELAEEVARALTAEPDVAWRVHVREELGVDPDDLPSPGRRRAPRSPPSRWAPWSRCCRSCSAHPAWCPRCSPVPRGWSSPAR